MKKYLIPLFPLCCILLIACQPANKKVGEFMLLPQPQSLEITGTSSLSVGDIQQYYAVDGVALPVLGDLLSAIQPAENESRAQIVCKIDQALDLKPEGYTLEITGNQVFISGKDAAGLLYGFMTLEQLMEDAREQEVSLPLCSITDYPLLSYRAIHLDVKHHLEKTEYYYALMDQLAGYKINAIIAEMEDKLGYERQPLAGSSDALSMEEWKKLSEYAMERNIEISPLIQGLGHASFILKHEAYRDIRDDPESDWAFNPLDPRTYEVQFDLYRDALEVTPYGRYLHVGGDEVHTTGRGSGKSQLELQLTWLQKVCNFAEENGRIPIFWDDMPLKHAEVYRPMFNPDLSREEVEQIWEENEHKLAEFLDQFPKNCVYMRWNYSTPQALGNELAMEWFREHGMEVMGATAGQTRWVLMPQNESNMENIRTFALSSIEKGLDGLLLTLWDDDSPHFELYMRGILAFAEYAWSGDLRTKPEIKSAYRHREFSSRTAAETFAFIDLLEKPVEFWNNALLKDQKDRRGLKMLENPLEEAVMDLPDRTNPLQWSSQYTERLEKAEVLLELCDTIDSRIETIKPMAIRNSYRLEVYEQVNNLVRMAPRFLLALQAYDEASNEQMAEERLQQIRQLTEEFQTMREEMEQVYGETRLINKPEDYLLDQDHHSHLANQTISFDWLFTAELLFLEKIETTFF